MSRLTIAVGMAALLLAGCYREERPQPRTPEPVRAKGMRLSDVQPGEQNPEPPKVPDRQMANRFEKNAYAMNQGQQLFRRYNCSGCHGGGGGGMGPALMDDAWIYGSRPEQVYASIAQGRPNGMPSFGGHVPEEQIWMLVAYVRSMAGKVRADAAPSRGDDLQDAPPPNRRERGKTPIPPVTQ